MIELNINPQGKPRARTVRNRYSGKVMSFTPDKHVLWCNQLKSEAQEKDYQIKDVLENITFIIQMPKSWSKKKKVEYNGKPHTQKPDLDNIIKGFQDALCDNDSFVHTFNNVRKIWGYEGKILIGEKDKC